MPDQKESSAMKSTVMSVLVSSALLLVLVGMHQPKSHREAKRGSELEVALRCEARGKHHHIDITVVDPGSA